MALKKYDRELLLQVFDECEANGSAAAEKLDICPKVFRSILNRSEDSERYVAIQQKHAHKKSGPKSSKAEDRQFAEATVEKYKGRKFGPFDIVPAELQWSLMYLKK